MCLCFFNLALNRRSRNFLFIGRFRFYFPAYAISNVMVEFDEDSRLEMMEGMDYEQMLDNHSCRRIRRPEATLQEAAEYVSSGETFQKVSSMFNIPISTIR